MLLSVALVCASFAVAVAIYYLTTPRYPTYPFRGSFVTKDSITVKIVETAPEGLDNPNIENTPDAWIELVENASETIDMEIYTIYKRSSGPIADFHNAIYSAAARGVRIRMLIDNEIYQHQETRALMGEFDANENIEVRQFSEPMHSKVIIVDNRVAYVGSANQSHMAMKNNREVGLVVRSSELARGLEAIFEAGWTGNENQPSFENGWTIQWIYPVATPIKVPAWTADTEKTIIGLINSAQHTVRVPVYVFSGRPLTLRDAVENAAARGVIVQIMVDADYGPSEYPFLMTLADNPNIQIKTIDFGNSSAHSKVVVVDGERAYVGSANWSSSSMTSRREIGIAFQDSTLASALESIFNTDWESSYAKWIKEPPGPLVQILTNAGIILVVLVLGTVAVLYWRRAKSKHKKRKWIAELWASSGHEV